MTWLSVKRSVVLATAILGFLNVVSSYGPEVHTEPPPSLPSHEVVTGEETYFQYPEHTVWIFLHILTMSVAWTFILPISRSPF